MAGSFWSRRKAAVEAEAAAEAAALRAAAEAAEAEALAEAQANKSDAELLAELGLPDPENLGQGDDFAAFMGRAVPEHLRRRALRKLWVSNPVLANLDGLVDHGEDYTDAATVIPGMQTAYQVGKGMMQHVLALAEKAAAAEIEAERNAESTVEDAVDVTVADNGDEGGMDPEPMIQRAVSEEPGDPSPIPRRHMRFEYSS